MELESSTTKIFDISIPLQMLKTTKPKQSYIAVKLILQNLIAQNCV